ncbi:hypothetical protein STA1M1_27880 [Sinisalibacter aestuarii]|uniref:Uncharacterized protein n=2 Tax=Sinisalibacter aestuarii TaxID=2949426 RepID=A0ABQ5LVB2_9RHOB|nr:hypothetical protein STA1M1_27880 [Sinisalibacter aestuarii]
MNPTETTQDSYRHTSSAGQESYQKPYIDWSRPWVGGPDTIAQWVMAFFTIGAVYLVWRTLISTQDMVKDTRRIGDAQTRAYVAVESCTIDVSADVIRYNLKIKNFGHSPATQIRSRISWEVSEGEFQEQWMSDLGDGHSIGPIPPGSYVTHDGNTLDVKQIEYQLSRAEINNINAGSSTFWIFGEITYRTLERINAVSTICGFASQQHGRWVLRICSTGNDMT